MELPATSRRVADATAPAVNEDIAACTADRIRRIASRPEEIGVRLGELDREWDIERTLEANAASITLVGLALGATVDRRFFVGPAIVAGFLLQHALQGWCPPVPVFRRLGVRTQTEIDEERTALRLLRGDFELASTARSQTDVNEVLAAVRG